MGVYLLTNDECGHVDSAPSVSKSTSDMDMHRNVRLHVDEYRFIVSAGNQK